MFPSPKGHLEILYQLFDDNPSYYKEHAKSAEEIIKNADIKDFTSSFNTLMDSKENNILRCISFYIMKEILKTHKIDDFLLKTRNDYLPLYFLDNLNFHENMETKSRFNLGYPTLIDLGYPSLSRFFLYLYNLNPTWPEIISIINENKPSSRFILLYFALNIPLSITTKAIEDIFTKNIREVPQGFGPALANYKEKVPIELIARYVGELKYNMFPSWPAIFIRYHKEILANKQMFTKASSIDSLLMLLKYGIYTPFDYDFENSVRMLTEHFCVIDGEQRGYENPRVYNEFRVYMKKMREIHPDKYAKFLSEADETSLSAFSFEYDENVAKRVFEHSYCPWVYVVLFHDQIPKSLVPWGRLDEFEPAPDLVNSIKLYNGIDKNLMEDYLNKMSVAKFVYLFHDYYDCKSIPNLKERLINDKRDYDPMDILFEAIKIVGDAVDMSEESNKYFQYCRLSTFISFEQNMDFHLSKENAKILFSRDFYMNSSIENAKGLVWFIKRILTDYPELVEECKEKLLNAYYAPLFLKEFIQSYDYDPLDLRVIEVLVNVNGVESLSDQQLDILISSTIKDCKFKSEVFNAVSKAVFQLKTKIQANKASQAILNLLEYFIIYGDNYDNDPDFLNKLKEYLDSSQDVKQHLLSILPKSLENIFDYLEIMYKIKI